MRPHARWDQRRDKWVQEYGPGVEAGVLPPDVPPWLVTGGPFGGSHWVEQQLKVNLRRCTRVSLAEVHAGA